MLSTVVSRSEPRGFVKAWEDASVPKIEAPTVAEHHAMRRAAILDAATQLLSREGVQAVTPAAVASSAGLARSSVYQYYPSTGALIAAGVEETFRRLDEALDAAMSSATTPQERVSAYVDVSLAAAVEGHQPMSAYLGLEMPEHCRASVVELHVAIVTPLVNALTESQVADARGVAELVNGVVSAGAAQVRRGEPVEAVRARVLGFVRAALA